MTSEPRPAVEVIRDAFIVWEDRSDWDYITKSYAAAAVIEADREAVRAEQAADLAKFKALAETLAGALEEWDELIKHQYFGSREAMSGMNYAAQRGLKALRQWEEARDAG